MNQDNAESGMPISARVPRRWFTVLNATDRLRRMRTGERDEALAALSDSVAASRLSGVCRLEA